MMRLWPDANTCTMRPARMLAANQSAAVRTADVWAATRSTSVVHCSRYRSAGFAIVVESQRMVGGADGAGVFTCRGGDNVHASSVRPPFDAGELSRERTEQPFAGRHHAAAEYDPFGVEDVDKGRDRTSQGANGSVPDFGTVVRVGRDQLRRRAKPASAPPGDRAVPDSVFKTAGRRHNVG